MSNIIVCDLNNEIVNEFAAVGEAKLDKNKALERFLMEIEKKAYIMAKMAVNNSEDALDLLQESMIAFIKSYATRKEAEWSPLFYRILQNRIHDFFRRSTVRNRWRVWLHPYNDGDGEDRIESMPDQHSTDPAEELSNEDFGKAIVDALQLLPVRQQQVFMLRVWDGLSVADTAIAMECSQGSVKTHLSRAMRSLRSNLAEYRI